MSVRCLCSVVALAAVIALSLVHEASSATQTRDPRLAGALEKYRQGRLEESAGMLRPLLPDLRSSKDFLSLREALNVLSLISSSVGDYEDAATYASEAVKLRRELKDPAGEAASLNNLGLARLYLGDYPAALENYQSALEIDRRLNDGASEVLRLNNIANVHYVHGSYSTALSLYLEALEKAEAATGADWANRERYRTQANLAVLYQKLGQNERALALYKEMLQQPQGLPGSQEAQILTNVGVLYRHLGDHVKALDAYREARKRFAQWRHLAGEIGVLRNIGILQSASLGDHASAVQTFSEVIELAEKTGNARTEMQGRLYRGEAQRLRGDLNAAQEDFEASLATARSLGAVEEQWKSLFGLGRIAEAHGQNQEARERFESSLHIIESLRARLSLSSMRSGFLADKRAVYDAIINSILKEAGHETAATLFGLMERAKARTFQDSLAQSIEAIQKRRAPETLKRLRNLRGELTSLWSGQLKLGTADEQRALTEYNRLENEYTRAEEDLRRTLPLGSASPPGLAAAQSSLEEAGIDLLIEYWLGEGYLAWVWVTPTESGTGSGPAPDPEALRDCLASISDRPAEKWRSGCGEVSALLLQPIRERSLSPGARVAIVPDGILQSLPFDVLEMPHGRLLVEVASAHYLPSAAFLPGRRSGLRWSSRAPWSPSLIALGDPVAAKTSSPGNLDEWAPLPHSREEVRDIADLLPGRKSLHLGPDARKEQLPWTPDRPAPIVHLATHGAIDFENPDRSRIVFSGTPQAGPFEYLFLREITGLDLSGTQLVTLSACETSRGKLIAAEGAQDFSRMLMLAGARITLTTLWKVPDESTSQFMQQFYYGVSRGRTVSDALRDAKLRFLHSDAHLNHPAYWAAFVATGDAGVPVDLPVSWSAMLSGVLVSVLVFAGGAFLLLRRKA